MDFVQEAFERLYPGREFNYDVKIRLTDHFKDYGANVKMRGNSIEFGLSKKWRGISREIKMGLIQELMLKLWGHRNKKEINTTYIDLYNSFVRNIHIAIPKTETHPVLSESFERVNDKYFYGIVEKPNLVWGSNSKTHLGSYDYKRDTIKISMVFDKLVQTDPELLDFVMHHEILHKSHKFKSKLGNNRFHDKEFRRKERAFDNFDEVDRRLKKALAKARIKSWFFG